GRAMALSPDPKGWLLSDLAAIEDRIKRSAASEKPNDPQLDARERRYRQLVENSLGLICTHDLNGVLLSVNPAAAGSLGYEPQDAIGRNLRDFLAPNTRHLFGDYLGRIRERSRDSGLMRVVRRDGSERLWLYRNVLVVEPGTPPYVIGHGIDVTERATAEAALRKNQSQTLEVTQRLAGHVAHAFNNMLTLIVGSAELLQTELPSEAPARVHIENILNAASRGAAVTRQLLAVGGQQIIDRGIADVNAIVTGLQSLIARLAGPRSALQLVLDPSLPNIEGDTTQIEQMLLHLAANARDAMEPDGGTLTIETSVVGAETPRVPENASVGDVRLTVRDTGCGMDAGTKARVFEPFFTTKSGVADAGLGLSTVYGIVRQHGGTISVDSERGRGTVFTIALPQASGTRPTETPIEVRVTTYGPNTKTVVVVDDQDEVRSLMGVMLRRQGYGVLEAASGVDAIRMIESHPGSVDLLVTDVMMPGMGGRELYDYLSARHPAMKVLFVSGYTEEASQTRTPGTTFLAKPFLLDTLAKKVREILDAAQ
ncbi:MAG TPA: ATP-binding protein, partial [Vicinamibacterales bacterium]|nr:ATP-binding protein [Vicinamibacterales bacterium]